MGWFKWDRTAVIRQKYGSAEAPSPLEFTVNTLLCAALILPTYFAFSARNEWLRASGQALFEPLTPLDAAIPLVPEFIWVYYLFYPAFFVVALATTADRRVMYEGVLGYGGTALIGLITFGALPSQMNQPSLAECMTISCRALENMYGLDDGHHIFPSLHVAYPMCAWLLLRRTLTPWISRPFFVVFLLIAASTVLLKRHALVDVPAGALTGSLGYLLGARFGGRIADAVRARWATAVGSGSY